MRTTDFDPKFVPVTVIVTGFGEFTGALIGETLVMVGGWPRTVNGSELLVLAPSCTLTCTRAVELKSVEVSGAVSWVALTKVGVFAVVPHITTELLVNPVLLTVNGVAAPGAITENGESLLTTKAGVFGPGLRLRSHKRRPCVAARNVLEGL